MKEEIITFETAKLAKKKGFTWDVKEAYYASKDELSKIMREECWNGYPVNTEDEAYLAAPTQSLLQKWLREVHKIIVEPWFYDNSNDFSVTYAIKVAYPKTWHEHDEFVGDDYKTYEEALEQGLIEALKLIKV